MAAEASLPQEGHYLSTLDQSVRLGPDRPFFNYDLGLTESEKRDLKALNIDNTGHYENYGALEFLPEEIYRFLISLAADNFDLAESVAGIVIKVIEAILEYTKQETAWITLRAFTPVAAFKQPRWHADRYDYPPSGEQYKAAVTLKGPGTLFYNASTAERARLESIKLDKTFLDKAMDKSLLVSAETGQGTIFSVGASHAPIHSEPDIRSTRLFLAVMPGSKAQIEKVYRQTPEQIIMPLFNAQDYYSYFVGPHIKDTFIASPYEDTEIVIFKLSYKDNDILETISTIVHSHNHAIRVEPVTDAPSKVKVTLPEGGAIIVNDISWFFSEKRSEIKSEDDVHLILKKYAEFVMNAGKRKKDCLDGGVVIATDELVDTNICASELPRAKAGCRYVFNTITGKNTSGLFKPYSAKQLSSSGATEAAASSSCSSHLCM